MYKFINAKYKNEKNFVYAVCNCSSLTKGIEIPRPDYTSYITFKCPKCNQNLGIIARGKKEERFINIL